MSLRILVTVEDQRLFERCRECGFDAQLERPGTLLPARLRKILPDLVLATPPEIERWSAIDLPHRPAFVACVPKDRPELGRSALEAGATDILSLPAEQSDLQLTVLRASRLRALAAERDALRSPLAARARAQLGGESRAANRLNDAVLRVAATPGTTVLLRGEKHAGASEIARAIHLEGKRAQAPFFEIDCSEENSVLDREDLSLFRTVYGTVRGGTLHLSEVGQLSRVGQSRLRQVLEDRSPDLAMKSDEDAWDAGSRGAGRIIASSSEDLDRLCDSGEFDEDLLYRLNVLVVSVPPLRERKEDLHALARAFFPEIEHLPSREAFLHLSNSELEENLLSLRRFALGAKAPSADPVHYGLDLPEDDFSVRSAERALIELVLERTGGNRSEAARLLEVNRTTLYNKLRTYGL